jgi:hypothetical protein
VSTESATEEKQSSAAKPSRGKPSAEGRFIWMAAVALERIVNKLGATEAAFGVAVYVALCRLSSKDRNASTIEATIQEIAGAARLSYPKTRVVLDALEEQAKVIAIERRERRKGEIKQLPHLYTLIAFRRNTVSSGRRNTVSSAGVMEQANHYSEIPKDSPEGRESLERNHHSFVPGFASQPAHADGYKGEW